LHKLTGGRVLLSAALVPSLVLHTVGAKSGEPRDAPLACLPDGDGFYIVGSNFGREKHPAWTGNLLAHPDTEVTYRSRRIPMRARLLDADEKAAIWPELTRIWPTYDRYVERSGRDLRVFRLDPR
jgi:deazaflavin-dependent oxidoreductase (nitroreductase family)